MFLGRIWCESKSKPDRLNPQFLTIFLNSSRGRAKVMAFATKGVTPANVNASNLAKVELPLPPVKYQQAIVTNVEQRRLNRAALDEWWKATQKLKSVFLEMFWVRFMWQKWPSVMPNPTLEQISV